MNSDTIKIGDILFIDEKTNVSFKWPITWNGITSDWGYRVDPISGEKKLKHNGLDLRAKMNTPVYAPDKGIVRIAGWLKGYGKK